MKKNKILSALTRYFVIFAILLISDSIFNVLGDTDNTKDYIIQILFFALGLAIYDVTIFIYRILRKKLNHQ